jgi:hypothetical protein
MLRVAQHDIDDIARVVTQSVTGVMSNGELDGIG